jgi:hypothetical protein
MQRATRKEEGNVHEDGLLHIEPNKSIDRRVSGQRAQRKVSN